VTLRAVLFDFGGVFIDSPFDATDRYARRVGLEADQLTDVIFGSYERDTDHPWHRLERGELTVDEAREQIAVAGEVAGLGPIDLYEVLAELGGASRNVRDHMVDVVRTARGRGIATSVVTNNVAEFGEFWRKIIPLDELFDDVVDSSAVGVRKPDAAIFSLACERLSVEPGAALFVDDHPGNVAGAEAAGLDAICCGFTVEESVVAADRLTQLITST